MTCFISTPNSITMEKTFVFDFDSTIMQVEALDMLADINFEGNPQKEHLIKEFKSITDLGIDGEISFTESLSRRLGLLDIKRSDLDMLTEKLKQKISKSFEENKPFFEKNAENIYIISCGFKEFIDDIASDFAIPTERVYANTFVFDEQDKIIGFDTENVLSKHNGKVDCLRNLNLKGEIQVIGDGYSDFVMKEAGIADKFFAFTENIERLKAIENADHITPTMDEFLYINKLPRNISYPKHRIKILLLENIHSDAFDKLSKDGFTVETVSHSLSEEALIEKIKGIHVLGIRSKTTVTEKVLAAADKLMAIGAFCIGTKQIDLEASKRNGVVVFNAPYSNTRSVVELALGEIIILMRNILDRNNELHAGEWNKTATGAQEIRSKKLGIIGYGNIGKQLSVLAESIGMDVYYYDIADRLALGNATRCQSLEELLKVSDAVSIHIDDQPKNHNFFGKKEIAMMKKGAVLVNLSRGFVVDIPALKSALESGKISGAAVDVFPVEPRVNGAFETELQGLNNVILTPHIGGSTLEAQKDIASFVPKKILSYINNGNTVDSVNFPSILLPSQDKVHRFLHIHENVPGVMAKINDILLNYNMNITRQYLATDSTVGYAIVEVDDDYNEDAIEALKNIPNTIKFRVLY